MSAEKNSLRGFIYTHFGGYQQLAKQIGVSTSSVSDWVHNNPRNLLKYLPEVCEIGNVLHADVVNAVLYREREMK